MQQDTIVTHERREGPTPAGGDYSEAFYLDKNHNTVDKSEASLVVIRECKRDGTLINETFLVKDKTAAEQEKKNGPGLFRNR